MKTFIPVLLTLVSCIMFSCSASRTNDSVRIAKDRNERISTINSDVADFLVKIADARMMGKKEGELAIKKGTTPEIINYGKLMIKDQASLLRKIKKLAAARNIQLPGDISDDKRDGYNELNEKTGHAFDNKFIKMMRIDHERDIKDFKKAHEFTDKEVAAFSVKYLPLIEEHLAKLKQLKHQDKD